MSTAPSNLILITLLIEMGVAAAVAAITARSARFKELLLKQNRSRVETLQMMAMVCVPLTIGVWIRVRVPNFLAADISLEACVLFGILFGTEAALLGATVLALPALAHHEFFTLPMNLSIAAIAGAFARFTDPEDVWTFSPMIDLSIYRWIVRNLEHPSLDRQVFLLVLVTCLEFLSSMVAHFYPRRYFDLFSPNWMVELAICACAPVVVGIPLKIWNSIRLDKQLEDQRRLLMEARLDALQRQINPHFLFNTLNSIASLVRFKPELAREMIVKLANILRVLLKGREAFVPFSEELSFTDDYLDIEVVRFGDKLRVVKEIAPETLDIVVPGMLLQPLLENSIKHGIEPRISGGTVTVRSRIEGDRMVIEVEDDGVGMSPERNIASPSSGIVRPGTGIGMRNVRERMEVLYGDSAVVEINSRPGRGTRVTLIMPVLNDPADAPSLTQALKFWNPSQS